MIPARNPYTIQGTGSDAIVCMSLPKGKVTKFDLIDLPILAAIRWSETSRGYVGSKIRTDGVRHSIIMSRLILGPSPDPQKTEADHKDHDRMNNQRSNLRWATRQENVRNRRNNPDRAAVYRGVQPSHSRWKARIRVEGSLINLGCFVDPKEAALAYDEAARKHFGEFAVLNFPKQEGRE